MEEAVEFLGDLPNSKKKTQFQQEEEESDSEGSMEKYMRRLGREMESEGDDRPNRRKSVLMESMNNLTKVVNSVPLHVVQEPDISHLYLQDMEPRHVIALIEGAH